MSKRVALAEIEPAGFFVFRTPMLPFGAAWLHDVRPDVVGHPQDSEESPSGGLRHPVYRWLLEPVVREGLRLASSFLEEQLPHSLSGATAPLNPKVRDSVFRYLIRMSTRATPFGVFAGVSVGTIGRVTQLAVATPSESHRFVRLDSHVIDAICEALANERPYRRLFEYRPNATLLRAGGYHRFLTYHISDKGWREYSLASVRSSAPLRALLANCREGSSWQSLLANLHRLGASGADADAFIHELIDERILVPNLELALTAMDPLGILVEDLRRHPQLRALVECLDQVRAEISALNSSRIGTETARYERIRALSKSLPGKIDERHLFHVDMRRPSLGSSMGSSVIHEISRAIGVLHLLQLARRQPDGVALLLGDFTRAFLERYGDREVPLTVALDVESGVNSRLNQSNAGETVPLLRGMPSPPPESGFQQFLPGDLFERTLETIASGRGELALDDLEFPAVALANTQPLPPAFAVMGSIEAADSVALQQGKFKVLIRHCQGASGAGWMGRFSFGTPELESLLRSYLRTEEAMNPLAVFAEVAHLPQGRAGNVVARPPLRAYEICFLAGSGVDLEHRISLDDLNVSVRNGHIMLRSRRLNREVIPRMTHANNPMAGVHLPHYKFLYMLQFQGEAPLYWHWCELDASPYLPRVVAGKAVLSLARWKISAHLVTAMRGLSPERSRHALREMFTTRRIPRFVTFGTDDQLLTFDVADDYCADSLVTMIVRHSGGTLSEVFPAPDALCATGAAGSYEHEIIVPFLSRQKEHIARPRSVPRNDKAHAVHVPGSKWVFAKIYCGRVTADSQMRESIATLIRRAERLKLIDRWFFIRFSDPDWHIRLRMRARSARGAGQLVQLLHKVTSRSIRCGDIHRIVLDSYDPEVDRYGGAEATNLAEQVFMLDSSAVLEVLSLLPSDAGAADRWLVGLVTVHSILDAFRIPEMHRIGMLESSRDGQLQLLRSPVTPELRQWLSASDRKLRDEVAAAVEGRGFPSRGMARSIEVIGRLKSTLRAPLRQLQRLHETRRLSRPQSEIALSYVHMHLNRLLPFRQNEQEAIIYDLLARYYRSKAARDSSGRSRRDASGQGVNVKST